jgi:hypothetical protein
MLGILFIYFIGKYFYDLAIFHKKSKWLFTIFGVISYYAGTLLGGFLLGLFSVLFSIEIDWNNNILISVLAIPFGVGTSYLVYILLKRKWSSEVKIEETIDTIGKKQEQDLN